MNLNADPDRRPAADCEVALARLADLEMAVTLEVRLEGGRGYPVVFGSGLLSDGDLLRPFIGRQVLVVTNARVASRYLSPLRRGLDAAQVDVVEIGDGERFKTLDTYARIMDALVAKRHGRGTTVVGLGGGVVGDVAGFAAATYQRGVRLVQVPTTLLAQVDSSVGGKTAVNHPGGKNLIGAFHQPRGVIADVGALRTLPAREFAAGVAEVIKTAVIADADFFEWLEANMDGLLEQDSAALLHAVRRCCEIKAAVVGEDERELHRRAILNFGHTFGHAIEALTRYERHLHGEAVAIGMAMAMELSVRLGRASATDRERVRALLARARLPLTTGVAADALIPAMTMDKKARDGRIRLVLCDGVGRVSVTSSVSREEIRAAIVAANARATEV